MAATVSRSQLCIRKPKNATMAAATVAESNIRSWFEKNRQYLRDNNLEDVLTDPRRILNGDETMFFLNPVTKAVVASGGNRNVYLVQQADAKKNVTVLFTFDADGHMYDPDVMLPYKRLSPQPCLSFYPDWGIGKSERGWMDGDNFVGHIQNKLHPSLVRRNVPFPVIYFVDGHSSHTEFEAAEACAELGIILIALYPNATHIIIYCTLDLGGFSGDNNYRVCTDRVLEQKRPSGLIYCNKENRAVLRAAHTAC